MARLTRLYREAGKRVAREHARSMHFDDMPHGGVRSGATQGEQGGCEAWQERPHKRLVSVVMVSGIKQRWAEVVPAGARVAKV